ncbi:uncharacterized protein N7469_002579 [Penicillium citrinum]|uniref:Uncharacterized protein n=2 Tax=Penicillium TaxID=5073 RepID=A0A9W9PCY1_PENCI|nr:uncharacterized protein N7469_002579 [Penicillium citrinum]KAJ5240988.1 hypothetical protein N7469_002579 [Penicillium citrinum]KAJ5585985.1 hypothetical protein N7450_005772 [Penicillium hetheringtonii]KAK5789594.1 hypothetical protein VI817_008717 [Penicillium citrinum]
MASLWYCCGCSFGPHNSALYDACINCGEHRCDFCNEEKTYDSDSLNLHAHSQSHGPSPYPATVQLNTARTLSHNTQSMPIALPDLTGIRPLSRLRPTTQTSSLRGPAHIQGHTAMYICCKCNDGPKVWDIEPRCVVCNHDACGSCTNVK